MPSTDTRELDFQAAVEAFAVALHNEHELDPRDWVDLTDFERTRYLTRARNRLSAALLRSPAGRGEGEELRAQATAHAIYQALYYSLTLLERGWDAPLGGEAHDARRALRRAWVALTPADPAYDHLVPEADVERKMFRLWMQDREREIRESEAHGMFAALASPPAPAQEPEDPLRGVHPVIDSYLDEIEREDARSIERDEEGYPIERGIPYPVDLSKLPAPPAPVERCVCSWCGVEVAETNEENACPLCVRHYGLTPPHAEEEHPRSFVTDEVREQAGAPAPVEGTRERMVEEVTQVAFSAYTMGAAANEPDDAVVSLRRMARECADRILAALPRTGY